MVQMTSSILVVSQGVRHPSLLARLCFHRALTAVPGCRLQRVGSLAALSASSLASTRAVVLYIHQETISPAALERLEGFVGRGGGLLAVHSASASFAQEPRYAEILGGRFREHGPIEPFEVQPATPQDPVFAGIPPFTVEDELYRHDYDPENRIHFFTPVDGGQEPVVWTRHYPPAGAGRIAGGRVCYCALGHTVSSMRNPHVRRILQGGLAWVSGSLSERDRPFGRN
jgi:type 1 glutamine amidotransferase